MERDKEEQIERCQLADSFPLPVAPGPSLGRARSLFLPPSPLLLPFNSAQGKQQEIVSGPKKEVASSAGKSAVTSLVVRVFILLLYWAEERGILVGGSILSDIIRTSGR